MKWCCLLFLVTGLGKVQMANILALLPLPMYSHTSNFMPIFRALADRGHNITVVSPFPQKTPIKNLHDIVVPLNMDSISSVMPSLMELTRINERIFQLVAFWMFVDDLTENALKTDAVQNLIRDTDSKFDLIMLETFMFQEPLLAFGYKFNAPVINLHPSILTASGAYYTGNTMPSSYSPTRFSAFTDHMTFLERAETAFFHNWELLMNRFYLLRKQENHMRKYFNHEGMENLPPIIDMIKNTSLTLINHNSAVGYPFPMHKNVIEFGGINVKSGEELPADLKQIMDNATEGVIYFSFGSFFKLPMLPENLQSDILSAIGHVKQKVLIKWDNASTTLNSGNLPKNVEFRDWFPQASVLGHPNCNLFITHGGIASLMEGIYHGVPLMLIPLFADQKYNAKFAELNGLGLSLTLRNLNEERLLNRINSVLYNPRYKENIKERSAIFKDKPMNILENVIYWIEYVIRHQGAPHLRPAVVDLYWFQDLMLDVLAFYLLVIIFVMFIIKTIICFILRTFKRLLFGYNSKISTEIKIEKKKSKKE